MMNWLLDGAFLIKANDFICHIGLLFWSLFSAGTSLDKNILEGLKLLGLRGL